MPDLAHWAVFLAGAFVLLVTPGPSIMYVVARGIALGSRAAVLSAAGLALGDLLQVIATAVGLSALLASAPAQLAVMKAVGATYLVALGVATLLGRRAPGGASLTDHDPRGAASSRSLIAQGFLALNPKTTLFFLAFLPQFVAPEAGPVALQILTLGSAFVVLGFGTNSLFGCLGGKLGVLAARNLRLRAATRYASGGVLIALGIAAGFTPTAIRVSSIR